MAKEDFIIENGVLTKYVGNRKSIVVPEGVTSIGKSAFWNCRGLTSITIPNSVTSIGAYAFDGCTGLTSITIPNSVTSIGESAFQRCRRLTSIPIPDRVTSIGAYAFCNCTGLTSITIPDSVTNIAWLAFSGCTGLTSITIPDSVTSIGERAFQLCTGLASITIQDGVTYIGDYAFNGCAGLAVIHIPESVTKIGTRALASCKGLTSIDYEGTKEQWDAIGKGKNWNVKSGDYTVRCNDGEIAKMTMEESGDLAKMTKKEPIDIAVTSFEYSKKPRGGYKATLVGISPDEKELVFPGEHDGEAVTEVSISTACKALLNKGNVVLDRVVIPGTAKKYTDVISKECRTLVLEEGITTLRAVSIRSLEEIYLPKSLKVMERGALLSCRELKKIHIPAGSALSFVGIFAFPRGEGGGVLASLLPSCTVENGNVYIPSEDNPYFMLVTLGQSGAVNAATEIAAPDKALEEQNQIFGLAQPSYFLTLRELIERSDRQKEKPFALSEGRKIVGDAVFDENGTRLCGLDDQVVVSYFYCHHGWFWDTFVGKKLGEVPSPKTFGYRGWKYLSTVEKHRYAEYATVYPVIGDGSGMPSYDYEKEIGFLNVLSCREAFNLIGEVDSECG